MTVIMRYRPDAYQPEVELSFSDDRLWEIVERADAKFGCVTDELRWRRVKTKWLTAKGTDRGR